MLFSTDNDDDGPEAAAWFDEQLAPGEWINRTWIGGNRNGQMRMLDIVCPDATHRLLWRLVPSDDAFGRIDCLDYGQLQGEVDRFLKVASRHGIGIGEFAGPVTSIPGLTDEFGPPPQADQPRATEPDGTLSSSVLPLSSQRLRRAPGG
jgi:hypothetical protein